MLKPLKWYTCWLHAQWPAGTVEKLPIVGEGGVTNVSGLYIVGDLTGVPLLKFSADSGARAVMGMAADSKFNKQDTSDSEIVDIAIIGAGVSGFAAAMEAKKRGLSYRLFEATEVFSTVTNFPKRKPIFTYPTEMVPAGELQFHEGASEIKEGLLADLKEQTREAGIEPEFVHIDRVSKNGRIFEVFDSHGEIVGRAQRVIVGIGRSGNFRKLGIPGEDLDKLFNRLHDPQDFCGKRVLIVGGGDSAMETAIALATCGCEVTLSYRKKEFSRAKPENIEKVYQLADNPAADVGVEHPTSERITTAAGAFLGEGHKPGSLRLMMRSQPKEIRDDEVVIDNADGEEETIPNDAVFAMIGREAPLGFFRRSGVHLRGEWRASSIIGLSLFILFCLWIYTWKAQYTLPFGWTLPSWIDWNPADTIAWMQSLGGSFGQQLKDPKTLLGTIAISAQSRGFYYTLAYCTVVVWFGIRRIRRRRTPYVKVQTLTLMTIQCVPLFLLPEIILPWLGHHGAFDSGFLKSIADNLFPEANWGHGREYWRAYGFILAWPLMAWNWFTDAPLWGWLIIGFVQTFVLIPLIVHRWGKGAYCGWICSCGALAETLGDTHRHKMPHGPVWNRLNMLGQVILLIAGCLMVMRLLAWAGIGWAESAFKAGAETIPFLNFHWFVDVFLAGVLGYGLYFWFSGRMWCRFACPLAALMHIYARFSRFRIFPEKKKCISCNICTSVCHQGIDIMNFANKGVPMNDPECVRCSACVHDCPTGVLSFGRFGKNNSIIQDRLPASPVCMAELKVKGHTI